MYEEGQEAMLTKLKVMLPKQVLYEVGQEAMLTKLLGGVKWILPLYPYP